MEDIAEQGANLQDSFPDNESGINEPLLSRESAAIDAVDGSTEDLHLRDWPPPQVRVGISSSAANETSQMALIGAKFSHIESLDYEIIDNDIFKQDWRSRTRIQILQYIILKWTLAFLVGLLTGVTGFAINMAVENIAGAKLKKTSHFMEMNRTATAFAIFGGSNLLLVLFAAVLCAYFSPSAAGSGIPEAKAYLNGIDAPNILAPKTLVVKILGSIGAVAGGLYVGKEGPLVHIGACFASLLSQGGSRRYHLSWKWLRFFKNDRDRRDLVTCGAAAGVATAFRAPVGGVLFALEEATSWWRSSLLWRAFFTTAVVAVVLRTAMSICKSGKCGLFGSGGLIMFNIGQSSLEFGVIELFPVVILGVVGGLLGSLFTYINGKIVRAYSHWHSKYGPMVKLLQALVVSAITSLCMFGLPLLAACRPCDQISIESHSYCPTSGGSGNFKQFQCPPGHYNDMAGLFFNTNDDVIRILLSIKTSNEFRYISILIFLASSFILTLLTYGTAVPSGLFIPVIIVGATYGRLTGMIMRSLNGLQKLDEGLYAFLGAASFLGGSMRMTVSLCVILLELTDNLLMLPLTMLVLLISKTIGDLFNHSVYDQIVQIKGLPFLEEHPEPYMKHLTALDVCTCSLVTLSGLERVGIIVGVLKRTNHNAFPVIDEDPISKNPILYGLVLRSHLLVILKRREFLSSRTLSMDPCKYFSSIEFAKPGSGKGLKINDIVLSEEEQDMFVDLRPFTNTSPYTVVDTMSLAKAFKLFRGLGLRHLCVVPKTPGRQPIVGILTRHDFMSDHVLNLYPHLRESRWKRLRIRHSTIKRAVDWRQFWDQKKLRIVK
eukprot:c22979_g1_i1 orf=744-3236(-)